MAGDAGTETQHAPNAGPEPQEHDRPRGISWAHLHHLPPSHAAPSISLLPSWGRSCPLSPLPPFAALDLKALHWTARGRVCRVAAGTLHPAPARRVPAEPHQLFPTLEPLNTGALSASRTLEFGPEREAVPGPTGSRTLELLFLLAGPPSPTPQTPGAPGSRQRPGTGRWGHHEKVQLHLSLPLLVTSP